ncbi:MAG: hypothetical protein COY42_12970 [Armatimonadetes bacterium CG_4_10_14_0_8_um_filter_66_14]|nr:MAG: hypothetical protein COY42_12970 [Armatimonadetes bacterium CG_4_10_14_0_8_um_filter_66_14]
MGASRRREQQGRDLRFDAVFRSMGEGMPVVNAGGTLWFANDAMCRLVGMPLTELQGHSVLWLFEDTTWRAFFEPMVAGREPSQRGTLTLHTEGGDRHLSAHAESVMLPSGESLGFVCVFTDVTDFHELDRLKTDLIGFVSHELRRPLTVIKGLAKTLLIHGADAMAKYGDDFLHEIDAEADRLAETVDSFLDLARLQNGESLRLVSETFDVREFVGATIESQRRQADEWRFETHYDQAVGTLHADPMRLRQVLGNLLSNAVKYSSPEAAVGVSVSVEHDCVRFAIADQGRGVPDELLDKIFLPYYRVADPEDPQQRTIRGAGLGLCLCKILVELHGGRIWAESTPGAGSTFFFTVPLRQSEGLAREPT